MKNKHIVIVTTNFANGGTERRAMVLANGFAKSGYKVTYLVLNKIYPDVVYKPDDGVELVCISDFACAETASDEKEISHKWALKKKKSLKNLKRIAKVFGLDDFVIKRKINTIGLTESLRAFVMCNQGAAFISFSAAVYEKIYYAAEGLDCRLIFTDASAPQFKENAQENELYNKVILKQIKKAEACIFQTKEQKAYYGKCVKHNGYIVKNPITAQLPPVYTGERKHKIVNFCRTHPVKNLILLVDAFNRFSVDFPDYSLEIYGSTSTETAENYKSEVHSYILDLGLAEKAVIFNAVPDVHKRIWDYGMFVSSSDSEGLSNSMIEAMALGLPCVCTDCKGGGAREMIDNGENGLLVPVKDAEEMYKAMRRMVLEKGLAEKCSMNAAKVREELSVENIVSKWIGILESI